MLLLVSVGFSIDYVNQDCVNSTTERTIITRNESGLNESIIVSDKQCMYGCDEDYGVCYGSGIFTYEFGFMFAMMFMSFMSLFAIKILKSERIEEEIGGFHYFGSGLKILFFALALMFQYFLFIEIGSFSQTLGNTIADNISSVALSIAQVFFWLIFVILFFMFIFYFMDFFSDLSKKKLEKQKEKDDEYE